ncbi:HEPN domain-containing protein [Mucilaginibacter lacusdianchii]|uniref:HEPN domain-containing protein n=1 Tax=Mucilaginibacter lacusdianchii TaxID=2684211 RepID=UPI00131D90D3|nr:HEPN domain-containing protein [Mucilaginibacter sp. JXJ CY 39]
METSHSNTPLKAAPANQQPRSIIQFLEDQFQFWLNHADKPTLEDIRQMASNYTAIGALAKEEKQAPDVKFMPLPIVNFPCYNREELIKLLITLIQPTKVYCILHHSDAADSEQSYIHLIIIVPDNRTSKVKDFEPLMELVKLGDERLTCSVLQYCYLNQLTSEGHVFYSRYCLPDNLIYNDGKYAAPKIDGEQFYLSLQAAKHHLESGLQKAESFMECARNHFGEPEDSGNAITFFMLHQVAELTYRALLRGLYDLEIRNHSIRTLQKPMQVVAPHLNHCLLADTEEGQKLTALLEEAYVASRYKDDFSVTDHQVEEISSKVESLLAKAQELCKQHYPNRQETSTINTGVSLQSLFHEEAS